MFAKLGSLATIVKQQSMSVVQTPVCRAPAQMELVTTSALVIRDTQVETALSPLVEAMVATHTLANMEQPV